ncbi:MAG TPA: hypothetical protein PKA76_02570 [Pirellulaceae bacterium]|nr:hypothetical protein [Pirellulaceae bacterium]
MANASLNDLERFVKLVPADAEAWTLLAVRRLQHQQPPANSLDALKQARKLDPEHERSAELYSAIIVLADKLDPALHEVDRLVLRFPANRTIRFNLACAHALAGNPNQALYHLGHLAESGWSELRENLNDPDLDPLRHHPGFRRLVATLDAEARMLTFENLRSP